MIIISVLYYYFILSLFFFICRYVYLFIVINLYYNKSSYKNIVKPKQHYSKYYIKNVFL